MTMLNRIYADYLMPSRLVEYEALVQSETNWIESTRLNLRRVIEEMAWRWA